MTYRGSVVLDQSRAARLFRRDLFYAIDYATTLTETHPAMIFGDMRFSPAGELARSVIG